MSEKLLERIRAREQAKIRPAPEKPKKAKAKKPAETISEYDYQTEGLGGT